MTLSNEDVKRLEKLVEQDEPWSDAIAAYLEAVEAVQ